MSLKSWLKDLVKKRDNEQAAHETKEAALLREFVYLDVVSLHSLLVSQNATIPNEVSQAILRADEAELAGKVGADILGVAKAESSARYQTSNSNSTQSSRKAVIQTLFKEFRELPLDFKLAARTSLPKALGDEADISKASDRRAVESADAFIRGTLVEVEVTLAVDPVFKLGTMMTEWSAMADEFPGMFGNNGLLGFLRDSKPIVKVLDRFLAGLIPIKATSINYVVAKIDGREFVVHKAAIEGLQTETRPLHIVGVTEHLGYWRDIRRVLFSEARFTLLCRIARDGLHENWTPVKLADLFSEVAPDFVDQINAIRSPSASDTAPRGQQVAFGHALIAYKDAIVPAETQAWTSEAAEAFQSITTQLEKGPTDAAAQRRAFDAVRDFIVRTLSMDPISADADLRARQGARNASGLELFPALITASPATAQPQEGKAKADERMLDVEVIAIYW